MTSDEPGMSVSAPATRPPVQDSAVAIVSLRIRHRSSSDRANARASLPLMAHTLQGRRMVALAIAAMPSSRPVNPRRSLVVAFTATRDSDSPVISAMRARIAVRADLRALANQGHIEVGDASAARGDPTECVFEELVRRRALPLRVAGR